MKGLFLLAMLLMVPSVAYYQKQYYAEVLQGRLAEEVRRGHSLSHVAESEQEREREREKRRVRRRRRDARAGRKVVHA